MEGHHLLGQPVAGGVVGVLKAAAVIILHLNQAVQVVLDVLGGTRQNVSSQS